MRGEQGHPQEHPGAHEPSNSSLRALVREGAAWPLSVLWSRHYGFALAWALKKDASVAEDVVSESFDLVFQALARGGGPTDSFRAYLVRTMNTQFGRHWTARQRDAALGETDIETLDVPPHDEHIDAQEQQRAAAAALRELPQRWQQVIVAVDIEGRSVNEVAAEMSLTPNSTSVLLKRARLGLRKSWLGFMHPARDLPEECAQAVSRFSDIRWGKKNTIRRKKAQSHLDSCDKCTSRWGLFIEQAGAVGLATAGIIALSRDWRRRIAVPTLATMSAATLLVVALVTVLPLSLGENPAPIGELEKVHIPNDVNRQAAKPPAPQPPHNESETNPPPATPVPPIQGVTEDEVSGSAVSPGVLYYGDWKNWCEATESFSQECP